MKRASIVAALLLLIGIVPCVATAQPAITAMAPFDTPLAGRNELVGVVVTGDGTLYVSDRGAGIVYAVNAAGNASILLSNLNRPSGLALDAQGRLLIAEEGAGRVLRLEPTGALTVLATGIKTPRWIVLASDGSLYITAHRLSEPDGLDTTEGRDILRLAVSGSPTVVASGIIQLQGIALVNGSLIAATKGLQSGTVSAGELLRYPVLADGSLGTPIAFVDTGLKQPVGLVLDTLGSLYVSSKEVTTQVDMSKRAIGKVHPDARLTDFAANLTDPEGVALGPDGSLYLADGKAGRLLRFHAPAPPTLNALPLFTNQTTLTLGGTTEAGSRVDVFVGAAATPVSVTADTTGAFAATVTLTSNALNTFAVFATTHGGDGLTSPHADASITQDSIPPTLTFQAPPAGAYVRLSVGVQAQATDSSSGVATLTLLVDAQALGATLTPTPPAPSVTAAATWNTTTVPDGSHTLTATATDRAGNLATTTRVVIVDNTPPDTQITGGPNGIVFDTNATFTFTGTDNLTPAASLMFAWRVDGGAFTAFGSATSASFTGLAEGPHTFEVKARDLAGNEDPTPAVSNFTVSFAPAITDTSPSSGSIGTFVTITGARFDLGGAQVAFNGVAAVVRSITNTTITTTVPIGATTGDVTVTTVKGTGRRAFTVTTTGDFNLNAAPTTVRGVAGDQGSVNIAAGGSGSFTSLVSLNVSGAPAGVTPKFDSTLVAPGGNTFVTLAVASTVAPGSYPLTVSGDASVDGRTLTRTATFTLQVLAVDTPALTGRVLTAESIPQPIPNVTVTLGSAFTLTDAGGNFVLLAPPTGANMLFVDGQTASTPTAQFPIVETQVNIASSGATRVPFIIYLPKLDTANPIALPLDTAGFTTQEVKATTPRIPGLVVTIPQGTRIVGPDGNPVAQLIITPVPVDRSPMPFPPGKTAPLLFAIHPGGSVPSQPLPITFPNPEHSPPGTRADLFYFNLAAGTWSIWGQGTVSDDGTQIVSDPGVGLPRLAWHWPFCGTGGGTPPAGPGGGDPVDLFTGRFTLAKTDLMIPGRLPIMIQRAYNATPASTQPGMFGRGWTLGPYDAILTTSGTSLELIQPDQTSIIFAPSGPGQWTNSGRPEVTGAVITPTSGEFSFFVRFKDGTVHRYDRIIGFANAAGLSAITDRNGNTVTIERQTVFPPGLPVIFGRISKITDPAGRAFTLAYDTFGRVTTVTDPISRIVHYTYDTQSRLSTVTDPAGGVTTYTYDSTNRIVSITDPRGITYLTNEYDGNGRVVRQTQADGGVWRFDYTLNGRLVTQTVVTDPRGNPTTHRFNAQGFEVSKTDALGQTITYELDQTSNLVRSMTDALKRITRYDYDAAGNLTRITDPAANVRTFTYDPAFNKVASLTDPLGNITRFEYDAAGNLTATVDPLGARTTLAYNSFGQPVTSTDPLGNTTALAYDATGNLASTADPLGNATTRQYDTVGRLLAQSDPLGRTTRFAYDSLNRTTTITDALNGVTSFAYDPNGNLLTVTDARGNTTRHTYDAMDRLASRTDPVGATETFAYDLGGNLSRPTDRKGQVATYTYDPLNRRTSGLYADGSSTSFAYDTAGRLVAVTDSVGGTIENTYDVLDRLSSQSTGLGTIGYQYDALGRRTAMTGPGQVPVTYTYDAASRLRGILQAPLSPVALEYDADARRTRLTLPNGVATDYQYDAASRLTALIYSAAAGPLGDLTYAYDRAGNRVRVGGAFARTLLPDPVSSATYDAANRQATLGATSLTYDANGNLTSDGTTTYTWDARNRLVALTGGTVQASFAYDGLGRRIAKTINDGRTDFLYDGLDALLELTGKTAVAYLRGPQIDEAVARGGTEFYLTDALGSTVALTDSAGTTATTYTYEPFGLTVAQGALSANAVSFTGRDNDLPTGLYYYRARYYSPSLHRFVSEDPLLSPLTGTALSLVRACQAPGGRVWLLPQLIRSPQRQIGQLLNSYAYVGNNPVNRKDPTGLAETDPACLGRCRLAYAIVCSLFCDTFIELPPVWIACNAACFAASELACEGVCEKK